LHRSLFGRCRKCSVSSQYCTRIRT
jgi:hypothetical protein